MPTLIGATRQLTFAGRRSGEGYFSGDGRRMIFQSEREPGNPFYQIYLLDLESGDTRRLSPGIGKTTCGWLGTPGSSTAVEPPWFQASWTHISIFSRMSPQSCR